MPLHRFEAASESLALEQMAATLGTDALVLDMRESGGRYHLTAAAHVDEVDLGEILLPQKDAVDRSLIDQIVRFHRLEENNAQALRRNTHGAAELRSLLADCLQLRPLPWPPPPQSRTERQTPLAIVGSPGAGKTACCARLALAARLAGQLPQIVTLDEAKTGSREQLKKLLAAMDLTLSETVEGDNPTVIDTSGVNPYSVREMANLLARLKELDARPVLIMDAGRDAVDVFDQARSFAAIGVRTAIVSKLDLARRLGSLFSFKQAGIELIGATVSPMIAKPVMPLTPAGVERLLLRSIGPDSAAKSSRP